MPLLIKICGLSTPDTLDAALDAGADMVGFVFFRPSPRHLEFAAARALAVRVGDRALKVALTVDADETWLAACIEAVGPGLLQFHGGETPDAVRAMAARCKVPVMKALAVETAADLARVADYRAAADRILFDARAPKDATRPGGLGKPFDWHILENLDPGLPFMLSGGLDAGNVGAALGITRPGGVDVSSGVERAPGEKDADKIRAFIRAARAGEAMTGTHPRSSASGV
ncbi:MAG: phosphoribosylanthranilate isomerase [Xanthobacteraceae bacterium]|nr:MAG: phosphoribosylanthranilate isomerase [Xanthobacteraceae bacterium]